jgi:hypothetical protein
LQKKKEGKVSSVEEKKNPKAFKDPPEALRAAAGLLTLFLRASLKESF